MTFCLTRSVFPLIGPLLLNLLQAYPLLHLYLLRLESAALRALREGPATRDAIARAVAALSSKHEGLRSLGAAALGHWGLPAFVPPLREALLAVHDEKNASAIRRVLVKALMRCCGAGDAEWVAECIFEHAFVEGSHDVTFLLRSLPWPSWIDRVKAESEHPVWKRRKLATDVLAWSAVPAGLQAPLWRRLLDDSDANVRGMARLNLAELARQCLT